MKTITLALLVACGGNPARTAIDAEKTSVSAATGWTCPMHPQVHADGPGPCPTCAMPLIRAGDATVEREP